MMIANFYLILTARHHFKRFILIHEMLTITLRGKYYYYLYFIDEETEAHSE